MGILIAVITVSEKAGKEGNTLPGSAASWVTLCHVSISMEYCISSVFTLCPQRELTIYSRVIDRRKVWKAEVYTYNMVCPAPSMHACTLFHHLISVY
jgi:hypothetical protein